MKYLLTGQSTTRLRFRLLTTEDFNDWMPLFYETNVALHLGMNTALSPKELCEKWFEKSLGRYASETGGMNVLVDKSSGKLVGQCGLLMQNVEGESFMEIGYSVLPQFWGKGYASEAAIKCKEFAFENNFADQLMSMVHVENIGSEKVAKNNGMTLYKHFANHEGRAYNLFSISKVTYLKQKKLS